MVKFGKFSLYLVHCAAWYVCLVVLWNLWQLGGHVYAYLDQNRGVLPGVFAVIGLVFYAVTKFLSARR